MSMKEEVHIMKVNDIMTKPVVTVSSSDTIEKAACLMKEHDVGSIPVCDGNRISGIVTDRDITIKSVASGKDIKSQHVSDVMSTKVVTGNPSMSLDEASRLMSEHQIRRLPIVDNNSLVGMVALGDLATETKSDQLAGFALSGISEGTK